MQSGSAGKLSLSAPKVTHLNGGLGHEASYISSTIHPDWPACTLLLPAHMHTIHYCTSSCCIPSAWCYIFVSLSTCRVYLVEASMYVNNRHCAAQLHCEPGNSMIVETIQHCWNVLAGLDRANKSLLARCSCEFVTGHALPLGHRLLIVCAMHLHAT